MLAESVHSGKSFGRRARAKHQLKLELPAGKMRIIFAAHTRLESPGSLVLS
jgi:hypothetical protein